MRKLSPREYAFVKLAVRHEMETGLPAEYTVAQWAQESTWGKTVSGKNNVMGITYRGRHIGFTWRTTWEELTEVGIKQLDAEEQKRITRKTPLPNGKFKVTLQRRFADFETIADCLKDRLWILENGIAYQPLYRKWRADPSSVAFSQILKPWASASYVDHIEAIAQQQNVKQACAAARKELEELANAG